MTDPRPRSGTWTRARGVDRGLRIWLREGIPPSDVDALRRCAVDEPHWQELPKLAQAPRSSVARLQWSSGPVVVKRYIDPGAFRLRTFARRSRAEREACALDLVGSVLPENPVRALAWAEQRRLGLVARSYLVTAELEESFDLRRIKTLDPPQRDDAIRVVQEQLSRLLARLHAANVVARTLRGKNALLQPASGRIALIDLPYARAVTRLGVRQRIRDLAILSLELRRFLDAEDWNRFLAAYRAEAGDLAARDADRICADRIARRAKRLGHRTGLSAATRAAKRRFRHSGIGEWVTGHRYRGEPD